MALPVCRLLSQPQRARLFPKHPSLPLCHNRHFACLCDETFAAYLEFSLPFPRLVQATFNNISVHTFDILQSQIDWKRCAACELPLGPELSAGQLVRPPEFEPPDSSGKSRQASAASAMVSVP